MSRLTTKWALFNKHANLLREWGADKSKELGNKTGYSQAEIAEMALFDKIDFLEKLTIQQKAVLDYLPQETVAKALMIRDYVKNKHQIDLPADEIMCKYNERFNDISSKYEV